MNQRPNGLTRRRLLQTGAAVALPWIVPARALGLNGVAPSERITLGVIGYGGRCAHDLACMLAEPDLQCLAISDVQASRRKNGKTAVDNHYGNQDCVVYRNMHEMLARPDIDAVLIATGDRWHAPASIIAAKAGKDIYCEKPSTMTIAEGALLAATIHQYGRVYQAGTQRRSITNFQIAQQLAQSGKLGRLRTLHASLVKPAIRYDWLPAQPEPSKEVVDWDMWLGPCPWRPFNQEYVNGGWRVHNDLSSGASVVEWGSHTVDLCQWANGSDLTVPTEYEAVGDNIIGRYASGVTLIMEGLKEPFGNRGLDKQFHSELGTCPVKYVGDDGWVETGDSGDIMAHPASLQADVRRLVVAKRRAGTDAGSHVRNFLDCVKSRARTNSNVDFTRYTHTACHAGAIAWLLKRKVTIDPKTEMFVNDEEANRLRSRAARAPWCI